MSSIEILHGFLAQKGDSRYLLKQAFKGFGLASVGLPFSFIVPMFGALAAFAFADLILVSFAMLVAAFLPLSSGKRLAAAFLLWGLASVAIEFIRLPAYEPGAGLYRPQVKVLRQADLSAGSAITIIGNANPIAYTTGPQGFVGMDLHQVGARYSWGIPLANRTHITDIPDLLWERGLAPNIDGKDRYRIAVRKTYRPAWLLLSITVSEANGDILAEYRRTLPLPLNEPGVKLPGYKLLIYSIFQDNVLRSLLGLNESINLNRELHDFFDQVLGKKHNRHESAGKLTSFAVISEETLPLPPNLHPDNFFREIGSGASHNNGTTSVCGLELTYMRFGSLGQGLGFLAIHPPQKHPVLLKANLSTNQVIDYYCDESNSGFWIFTRQSDTGQVCRVTHHAPDGTLQAIYHLQMPMQFHQKAVINKGSLQVLRNGPDSFSISTPAILPGSTNKSPSRSNYQIVKIARVS
jgi:hypothetical protein